MPRLLGVDIPNDKPTFVSLTYLFGVGRRRLGNCVTMLAWIRNGRHASWRTTNSADWPFCSSATTRSKVRCVGNCSKT